MKIPQIPQPIVSPITALSEDGEQLKLLDQQLKLLDQGLFPWLDT